ncbi:LysR family transcriptional regulator [Brevibacterium sp. H602]|uniref:LysR family transcriptional regulator n=1 Tax=unclassified Brevibacterium TaxID=2614124 RepID=UPI00397ADE08
MASIDLTLLRTFNAIFETRNLTRAAHELCVTQPSVSYALSRLRKQLGDRLFVRTASGVEPTVRAEELYMVFARAVSEIDAAVDDDFDPSTTEKAFRLCLSDLGELTFLPAISARMASEAPHAALEIVPMHINDVREWMRRGQVDAAVASIDLPGLEKRELIAGDRYVCAMPGGAGGTGEEMSLEEFTNARHVVVDQAAGHDQVEAAISAHGIDRRVVLRVPHFSVLPQVLPLGNLVAIIPMHVAQTFAADWDFDIRELPVSVPSFDVSLYSQPADLLLPATQWFMDLVAETAATGAA